MNPKQIHSFLNAGEGLTIEFKECSNALSGSVFEIGSVEANGDLNGDPNGDPGITNQITIPNTKSDT